MRFAGAFFSAAAFAVVVFFAAVFFAAGFSSALAAAVASASTAFSSVFASTASVFGSSVFTAATVSAFTVSFLLTGCYSFLHCAFSHNDLLLNTQVSILLVISLSSNYLNLVISLLLKPDIVNLSSVFTEKINAF